MLRVTARWSAPDDILGTDSDTLSVEYGDNSQEPFAFALARALNSCPEFRDVVVEKLVPAWERIDRS